MRELEQRIFSINPYTSSGIMGSEIRLNETVVDRYLEAADIRHHTVVTKRSLGQGRSVTNLGEVLAFKTFSLTSSKTEETPHFQVSMFRIPQYGSVLEIALDDQKMAEDTDVRLQKRYKRDPNRNPQEAFKEVFLSLTNDSIKEGLKWGLLREKLDPHIQIAGYIDLIGMKGLAIYTLSTQSHLGAIFITTSGFFFAAGLNCINNARWQQGHEEPNVRHELNVFLPVLPVDSYIRGRVHLAKKDNRLVVKNV